MAFARLRSIARYLARSRQFRAAATPLAWRAGRAECPSCGPSLFVSIGRHPFLTRCVSCRATVTGLSVVAALRSIHGEAVARLRAYELSSYGAAFAFLRAHAAELSFSEYFPGEAPGAAVDGIRNEDAQALTFPAERFDLVTSNQVFEHVPDDLRAFSECCRVLRPGGSLLFAVPLYDYPATRRLAALNADGTIAWLGEREFHDSRLGGPDSAPTFWRHSRHDIAARVAEGGFSKVEILDIVVTPLQGEPSPVVHAVK